MQPETVKHSNSCNKPQLGPVADLGKQYLQGRSSPWGKPRPPLQELSFELIRCGIGVAAGACGSVQMAHSFPAEIFYDIGCVVADLNKETGFVSGNSAENVVREFIICQ